MDVELAVVANDIKMKIRISRTSWLQYIVYSMK